MGEGAHSGTTGCLQTGLPSKQDSKVWRTLGPASEAQLVDAGVPQGYGRESITQTGWSSRTSRREQVFGALDWLCLPSLLTKPVFLSLLHVSLHPGHYLLTVPLAGPPPTPPPSLHLCPSSNVQLRGLLSQGGPKPTLLFQTPMTFVSDTGVTTLSTSLY